LVQQDAKGAEPDNRLLARWSRPRLPAPMLRDQVLFMSGLMNRDLGGPPVKPWQPDGLWQAVAGVNSNTTTYQPDKDGDLFRRSLYTFWKRGMPPPNMVLFDEANRETCSVGRSTTNTPLQALTTLNDPNFTIPAIAMAQRTLLDVKQNAASQSGDPSDTLRRLWLRTQGSEPNTAELTILSTTWQWHHGRYISQPDMAARRIAPALRFINSPQDTLTLATYSEVAEVLLNLDSTLTNR
jgi:hypothetical protein